MFDSISEYFSENVSEEKCIRFIKSLTQKQLCVFKCDLERQYSNKEIISKCWDRPVKVGNVSQARKHIMTKYLMSVMEYSKEEAKAFFPGRNQTEEQEE